MAIGNYLTPDGKHAYSYDTQILTTLPDGTELWNVSDYSRSTSTLQYDLFARKVSESSLPKGVRNVEIMHVLRGQTLDIKSNRVRNDAIASVYVPKNVVVLRNVPINTRDLVAYYLAKPVITSFPELCNHTDENKCIGCGGRRAHTLPELSRVFKSIQGEL